MRSRGGATGKAAGPFHLDLPAFPNQPGAAGGAHVLPLGPQTPSLLWVLLFFFTYLVFQPKETTSCFLTFPVLPQGMPCPWPVLLPPEILAVLLGPSSLPECSLSESAQTDVVSFSPNPCGPLSSEGSSCLVRNVHVSLSWRECEPLKAGWCLSYSFYSSSPPVCPAFF